MEVLIIFIIGFLIGEFIKTVRRAEQPLLPHAIAAVRAHLQAGASERGTEFDQHTGLCLRWEPDRIEHYDLLDPRETSMRKPERLEAEHSFDLERDCEEVGPGVWRFKYPLPDPPPCPTTAGRRVQSPPHKIIIQPRTEPETRSKTIRPLSRLLPRRT